MNRTKSVAPILAALLVGISIASLWPSLKSKPVHGQNINGVPNQVMNGFGAVNVAAMVVTSTITVGSATPLSYNGLLTSSSATPASIGASGCADTSYTFTGVQVGAVMGMPRLSTGTAVNATNIMIVGYQVTAANTVLVRYCNESTLSSQTPTAGSLTALFAW